MFRKGQQMPAVPHIDLATVRETVAYIRDDLRASPNYAGVCAALENVLREIDQTDVHARTQITGAAKARLVALPTAPPRFVRWTSG